MRRRIRDAVRTSRDVDAETRMQADEVLCGSSAREREGVTGCDPMILSPQGHRKTSLLFNRTKIKTNLPALRLVELLMVGIVTFITP